MRLSDVIDRCHQDVRFTMDLFRVNLCPECVVLLLKGDDEIPICDDCQVRVAAIMALLNSIPVSYCEGCGVVHA